MALFTFTYPGSAALRVKPSFHYWAGWIGPKTRRNNKILNSERHKMGRQKNPKGGHQASSDQLTDEYLADLLLAQDVSKDFLWYIFECAIHIDTISYDK